MNQTILEVKHLKKYYGDKLGIEDVSFFLKEGEIYGFIGPNGAGKSTTIRTIMGLIQKTKGEILFLGEPWTQNEGLRKEKIGYLPSEIHLYDSMTVKEILDYHESFYKKDIHKNREMLTKKLKVPETKRIEDLSLGNLKKVGIILALMHEPELIIVDEPTSGLDPLMQQVFHNLLVEEKEKGATILYSSHDLNEISNISDRIGFIKDGKIIKEDTMDNIKKDNYTYLTIQSEDIQNIKKEFDLKIIKEDNNTIKYLNNMDYNLIIKKLVKYKIEKLLIEQISLEELFSKYYK